MKKYFVKAILENGDVITSPDTGFIAESYDEAERESKKVFAMQIGNSVGFISFQVAVIPSYQDFQREASLAVARGGFLAYSRVTGFLWIPKDMGKGFIEANDLMGIYPTDKNGSLNCQEVYDSIMVFVKANYKVL